MKAVGIDLGGTKIEAQIFAEDWSIAARRRIPTPRDYPALVDAMAAQILWARETAGRNLPTGISAAGLVNPVTGHAFTANLPATGKPFPADIAKAVGQNVTYVNDCRALALSEAVFGAALGLSPVACVILGTGVGGGVAVEGRLLQGHAMVGGEFGHFAAPAHLVAAHKLPVIRCGCGRMGCTETYIAGPGLQRMAKALTGRDLTSQEIAALKHDDAAIGHVWAVWCDFVAEMIITLAFTFDPAAVVLGGGLSQIAGVTDDISAALARVQLAGFRSPQVILAEGGDASGARGAAYAALLSEGERAHA